MSHTVFASYNEFYDPLLEHPAEITLLVNKLEEEERIRRIFDKDGEALRRLLAHEVAELVGAALRPSWFQQGSSYVFRLLGVAREAGSNILRSSQVENISAKLQIAGQKAYATSQGLAHKVEEVGHRAQEFPGEVKLKFQEKLAAAQDVAHQKWEKVEDVAHQKWEKVGDAAHHGIEKANSGLEEVTHTVGDVAQQGIEKTQDIIHKLKHLSLNVIGKVNQVISSYTYNTNLAFAVLEEENERAYRLNSDDEVYAILNAMAVASLFKELAPEFYKPTFEPTRGYSTRLLEEIERKRRIREGVWDHTPIDHATAISHWIEQRFNRPILPIRETKKHVIEEVKFFVVPSASTAAM